MRLRIDEHLFVGNLERPAGRIVDVAQNAVLIVEYHVED